MDGIIPFSTTLACPKCGNEGVFDKAFDASYKSDEIHVETDCGLMFCIDPDHRAERERLECTCRQCGYKLSMKCADADPPAPKSFVRQTDQGLIFTVRVSGLPGIARSPESVVQELTSLWQPPIRIRFNPLCTVHLVEE